jgi:uncharacterized membrane protein YhhN
VLAFLRDESGSHVEWPVFIVLGACLIAVLWRLAGPALAKFVGR